MTSLHKAFISTLFFLTLLTGCSSRVGFEVNSESPGIILPATQSSIHVQKLFVMELMGRELGSAKAQNIASITQALSQCGIPVEFAFIPTDSPTLSLHNEAQAQAQQSAEAKLTAFNPDYVMQIATSSYTGANSGTARRILYSLVLMQRPSHTLVWKRTMVLQAAGFNGFDVQMGKAIANRLREENILPSCPAL